MRSGLAVTGGALIAISLLILVATILLLKEPDIFTWSILPFLCSILSGALLSRDSTASKATGSFLSVITFGVAFFAHILVSQSAGIVIVFIGFFAIIGTYVLARALEEY